MKHDEICGAGGLMNINESWLIDGVGEKKGKDHEKLSRLTSEYIQIKFA